MTACNLRVAIIGLCALAASVAVCHAQVNTAATAGASRWTAGSANFRTAGAGAWAGNKETDGAASGTRWTAAPDSFAEHAQPQGIWRESPPPTTPAAAKPASAELQHFVSASSLLSSAGTARAGVARNSHLRSAGIQHSVFRSAHRAPSSAPRHSVRFPRSAFGSGSLPQTIKAPSMPTTAAPRSSLIDQFGSRDK